MEGSVSVLPASVAYILVPSVGARYFFDGVTSVSHALSLNISQDRDASSSRSDFVTTARNDPDTVTLSVVATDTGSSVAGWAKQTLQSLAQIKEKLLLCKVVTSLRTYDSMLLSAISVQQDDAMQDGWSGTLTFTKAAASGSKLKSDTNASIPVSSGSTMAKKVTASSADSSGSVLQTILREAGINM